MTTSGWVIVIGGGLYFLAVLVAPFVLPPAALGNPSPAPSISEDRGGFMERFAHAVVLFLGRITFAALHLFEKLGVDMARVDDVLAQWTSWSENIKTQLQAAKDEAEELRATDAAEDAAQANELSESLADKIQAAFDAVSAPPVTEEPAPEEPVQPGPPETPPAADVPVEDVPSVPAPDPVVADEDRTDVPVNPPVDEGDGQ